MHMKNKNAQPQAKAKKRGYMKGGMASDKGYMKGGMAPKPMGYAHGGMVSAGSSRIKPTNQSSTKARGMGAATRGGNFKV